MKENEIEDISLDSYPNKEKYKIIKILGKGAFGEIYEVINIDDNRHYAIKNIITNDATKEELDKIKNESLLLSKLDNEHIVKYYESFNSENSFNIVMEYCESLDLRKFIKNQNGKLLDKNIVYNFILDICLGLEEIHSKNIIHRDLKPENIFLKNVQLKIGDFGIAKKINNLNEKTKSQVGTLLYMAPEIIKGEYYDKKVDIWSLGCIIFELCTLDYCFKNNSIIELINDINNQKSRKIDSKIYGIWLQNLIDRILINDKEKRPNINEILKIVYNHINPLDYDKKIFLFEKNEAYQNYLIDQSILNTLDLIEINVCKRELNKEELKGIIFEVVSNIFIGVPLFIITSFFLIPGIFSKNYLSWFNNLFENTGIFGIEKISQFFKNKIRADEKLIFIKDNTYIINIIEEKLISLIKGNLIENQIKEKVIIYNQENFNSEVENIKNRLILHHNKKKISKNYNIVLLGNTNVGKSTLINEFLNLKNKDKAKEGNGLETKTVEFKPYSGENNGQKYTLYDTNGITLKGEDKFEKKIESIEKEIKKRVEKKDPNQLIHCIWYCFQGSCLQEADGEFIKKLLNIYTINKIPIIFVHTKTFDKGESDTCRKALIKILKKIYNKDTDKIKEHLNNYIHILARGDEKKKEKEEGEEEDEEFTELYNYNKDNDQKEDTIKKAFNLDRLEDLSKNEIRNKGITSSYFEYLKNYLILILTNGISDLVVKNNFQKMKEVISKDIEKFYNMILESLKNKKFNLNDENKTSLNNIFNYYKNNLNEIKNYLKKKLTKDNLKEDNKNIIMRIYYKKSIEYQNKISYEDYSKNVDSLIYDNLCHNSNEVINNILNIMFILDIVDSLKNGIKEQLHEIEGKIVREIYDNLFED